MRCSARTAPGKTTLCNVLTGLYRPDDGYVEVGGEAVQFHSPRESQQAGIFMVHQHFEPRRSRCRWRRM